jgi:hypothetical protein
MKSTEAGRAPVGDLQEHSIAVLLLCAATLASCQGTSDHDLVGSWRSWDSGFFVVLSVDGTVRYDINLLYEELWTMIDGTYRVISADEIHIDIDHEESGAFHYTIEGDVLQLTHDSGRRMVLRREKGTPERKKVKRLAAIA